MSISPNYNFISNRTCVTQFRSLAKAKWSSKLRRKLCTNLTNAVFRFGHRQETARMKIAEGEKLPGYLFSRAKNDDSLQRERGREGDTGSRLIFRRWLHTPRNLYHRCNVTDFIKISGENIFDPTCCGLIAKFAIGILMHPCVHLKIFFTCHGYIHGI